MGNRVSQTERALERAEGEIQELKDHIARLEGSRLGPDAQKALQELSDKDVEAYVTVLLADEKTNIDLLPDSIERRIYFNVFRLMVSVVNRSLGLAHVEFLNHELKLQLIPMPLPTARGPLGPLSSSGLPFQSQGLLGPQSDILVNKLPG